MTEPVTGVAAIIEAVGTLIGAITGWLSSFTTWILADPLALMFYSIMFVMLAIHILHSFINQVK